MAGDDGIAPLVHSAGNGHRRPQPGARVPKGYTGCKYTIHVWHLNNYDSMTSEVSSSTRFETHGKRTDIAAPPVGRLRGRKLEASTGAYGSKNASVFSAYKPGFHTWSSESSDTSADGVHNFTLNKNRKPFTPLLFLSRTFHTSYGKPVTSNPAYHFGAGAQFQGKIVCSCPARTWENGRIECLIQIHISCCSNAPPMSETYGCCRPVPVTLGGAFAR